MISQSYSKNFGLYGERIGALSVTTNGGPEVAKAIQSQLKMIVRPMYSNPPSNGARIVAHVLSTPELYAEWVRDKPAAATPESCINQGQRVVSSRWLN